MFIDDKKSDLNKGCGGW